MATGKVVQVIGTVVDIEFPPDKLPALLNAVEITTASGKNVFEVQEHIGNNWVRCLALSPTDGLARGVEAVDTGAAISVPVGRLNGDGLVTHHGGVTFCFWFHLNSFSRLVRD